MNLEIPVPAVVTSTAPVRMTGTEAQLYRLAVEWQARAESKAAEARAQKKIATRRGEDLARCEQDLKTAQAQPVEPSWSDYGPGSWSDGQIMLIVGGVVAVFVAGAVVGSQIK